MTNEEGGHTIVESDTDTVMVLVHVTTGPRCPIHRLFTNVNAVLHFEFLQVTYWKKFSTYTLFNPQFIDLSKAFNEHLSCLQVAKPALNINIWIRWFLSD